MTAQWQHRAVERDAPGTGAVAVTASDVTVYDPPLRALFVGGAGNVTLTGLDGNDATFTGVTAGTILPVSCTKVKAATTATNITGIK